MNEVTKSYTKLTAVFSHIILARWVDTIVEFGDLTGNRQPFLYSQENLPVTAKFNYRMKKELTLGAPSVPVLRIDAVRFRKLLNRVLPAECQVKNATDCWYVGTIAATCLTFLFPPALALVAYCFYRAKKAEKGGAR